MRWPRYRSEGGPAASSMGVASPLIPPSCYHAGFEQQGLSPPPPPPPPSQAMDSLQQRFMSHMGGLPSGPGSPFAVSPSGSSAPVVMPLMDHRRAGLSGAPVPTSQPPPLEQRRPSTTMAPPPPQPKYQPMLLAQTVERPTARDSSDEMPSRTPPIEVHHPPPAPTNGATRPMILHLSSGS